MIRKLFNKLKMRNSGAALPAVLILSAVLLVMIASLSTLSVQQLQVSKSQKNIDYSYIGSNSMLEKVFAYIQGFISDSSMKYCEGVSSLLSDENYSKEVFTKIKDEINGVIGTTSFENKLDVANVSSNPATARIMNDDGIKLIEFIPSTTVPGEITLRIGVTVNCSFKTGIHNASNSRVYGEKDFIIKRPPPTGIRPAAVNGIGDLFASGDITVTINGDVKVVGTAPQKVKWPEQYFYGGVYVRENASLVVDGSVYSRAFIRTGNYENPDVGKITIKKNAIAQCIQSFGKDNEILIYKDAYTFDDLEMNGLNSIIAINGNYFGLSKGGTGGYHDASSAIVNSSIVHHPDDLSIKDAMKSKVVINGEVFINGGTFRVDPKTGDVLYPTKKDEYGFDEDGTSAQIEDASTAWSDDVPTYKTYEYSETEYFQGYPDRKNDWITKQTTAKGFGNLFQCWNTIQPGVEKYEDKIAEWLNYAKSTMQDYSNSKCLPDSTVGVASIPTTIRGFCNYEMAANGRMYFMIKQSNVRDDLGDDDSREPKSEIKRAKKENMEESGRDYAKAVKYLGDESISYFTWDKWDAIIDNGTSAGKSEWDSYFIGSFGYLKDISKPLIRITEDYVKREYKWDPDDEDIVNTHATTKTSKGTRTTFNYIGDELKRANSVDSTEADEAFVFTGDDFTKTDGEGNYKISDLITDNSKYYIIANNYPGKTLVLDSEMRGIIYTRGKLIVRNGAYLRGFVIASGKGYLNKKIQGSAADSGYMPNVYKDADNPDINNVNLLNNGDFASIKFEGYAAGDKAKIEFKNEDAKAGEDPYDQAAALQYLMKKFEGQNNEVYNILKNIFLINK